MGKLVKKFTDGSLLEYDWGKFDEWCVYLTSPSGQRIPPKDTAYFNDIKEYSRKYGVDKVYKDYCTVYDATSKTLDKSVLKLVDAIAMTYKQEDSLKVNITFSILYLAMLSEENKKFTILGKRIKRLGLYGVLFEHMDIYQAANYMKGKSWREIDGLCKQRNF